MVNGLGDTQSRNGLGNLIIGYQELRVDDGEAETIDVNDRSGSHNLAVGFRNNYSSYGGQVVGARNTISGVLASVSGGIFNTAAGDYSAVSGGGDNTALGDYSGVVAGMGNKTSGKRSMVSGGFVNRATGTDQAISGQSNNRQDISAICVGANWDQHHITDDFYSVRLQPFSFPEKYDLNVGLKPQPQISSYFNGSQWTGSDRILRAALKGIGDRINVSLKDKLPHKIARMGLFLHGALLGWWVEGQIYLKGEPIPGR